MYIQWNGSAFLTLLKRYKGLQMLRLVPHNFGANFGAPIRSQKSINEQAPNATSTSSTVTHALHAARPKKRLLPRHPCVMGLELDRGFRLWEMRVELHAASRSRQDLESRLMHTLPIC